MAITSITVSPNPMHYGRTATFTVLHDRDTPGFSLSGLGQVFLFAPSFRQPDPNSIFSDFTQVSVREYTFTWLVPTNLSRIVFWGVPGRPEFRASDPPPEPPSIALVADQNILVDTDYRLRVAVTGNPTAVTVKGDMKYFGYSWIAADAEVEISGTPEELSSGRWRITARYSSGDPLERDVNFNVIRPIPVFGSVPDIHLYQGVPINIDVPVANVNGLSGETLLLGLGLNQTESGGKIDGTIPADAVLTVTAGDFELQASHAGGIVMQDYGYMIEPGSPPAIGAVEVNPKGDYSEISFDDVNHAIEYQWQPEGSEIWYPIRSDRGIINPSSVKTTPGNLEVQIAFPPVAGADKYEWILERKDVVSGGENPSTEWASFMGPPVDGMITVIIPTPVDGESYDISLRVSSPWLSVPITIPVVAGRLAFVMQENNRVSTYLDMFHTGVVDGGTAIRIKRILLPTTITRPDRGGLAIDGDDAYIMNVVGQGNTFNGALYKFNWTEFDDGERVNNARRNPMGAISPRIYNGSPSCAGLAIRGDELYIATEEVIRSEWNDGIHVINKDQTDGATISPLRSTGNDINLSTRSGLSLSDYTLFGLSGINAIDINFFPVDFSDGDTLIRQQKRRLPGVSSQFLRGSLVLGEGEQVYLVNSREDRLVRYERDSDGNYSVVWSIFLPSGLNDPYKIDFLR